MLDYESLERAAKEEREYAEAMEDEDEAIDEKELFRGTAAHYQATVAAMMAGGEE